MQTVWLAQGPVRAAQWGLVASRPDVVWIEQWRTWLPEYAARGSGAHLLNRAQQHAVWQTVIDASAHRAGLLNVDSVARWAAQACSLLRQYQVHDPGRFGGGRDLATLLEWSKAWQDALAAKRWCCHDDLLTLLEAMHTTGSLQRSPRHLILLDIAEITPLEDACLKLLADAGWQIEHRAVPQISGQLDVLRTVTQQDELECALSWLYGHLEAHPEHRVALVAPREDLLDSALRRRVGGRADTGFAAGRAPVHSPPVAAAVNVLEMLGPSGSAEQLSAWLRSPFFHGNDPDELGNAARCELAERDLIVGQVPLHRQRTALIERIGRHAPSAAVRLKGAFKVGEAIASVAPLTMWTRLWQEQLAELGWMQGMPTAVRDRAVNMLQQAFDTVNALTPMLTAINVRRALSELRATVSESLIGSHLPVAGMHVLNDVDDIGPGYAAVWVMGMHDNAWPQRHQPNPFLPLRLQQKFDMPWSSAAYRRSRAELSIARLHGMVPAVVCSWSTQTDVGEVGPAAILQPWLDTDNQLTGARPPDSQSVDKPHTATQFETVTEALQPLVRNGRLSGGARLLNLQASCPLRAFIDYRLHARELPRRTRGISRALRGQILHRAAANLLRPGTQSTQFDTEQWSERIDAAADDALHHEFGNAFRWFAELIRFERHRAGLALAQLLSVDSSRGAFSVAAVEDDVTLIVDGIELRARVDRIDQLASGGFAIVDYKTGTGSIRPLWFDADVADFQMPLYAVASKQDIAALALCSLNPEKTDYRGFWLNADEFPRRSIQALDAAQWQRQIAHWQTEIAGLIEEFIAGDNAIYMQNAELALGMYAPLSRLPEVIAPELQEAGA